MRVSRRGKWTGEFNGEKGSERVLKSGQRSWVKDWSEMRKPWRVGVRVRRKDEGAGGNSARGCDRDQRLGSRSRCNTVNFLKGAEYSASGSNMSTDTVKRSFSSVFAIDEDVIF